MPATPVNRVWRQVPFPVEDRVGTGGRRPVREPDVGLLLVAGLGLVLVGVLVGVVLLGALALGRVTVGPTTVAAPDLMAVALFGAVAFFGAAAFFGAVAFALATVAARIALVTAVVADAVRRARFFRTGFGRNALIRAEGDRERRVRATNGLSGQETSSSPIRDQSSPGITKFTILGVSTIAGRSVFMACTK